MSKTSEDYLSNREWLRDIVGGKKLILCHVSALEYLQSFVGYVNEKEIEVYALEQGAEDNIKYRIVNSFDDIEYIRHENVFLTTLNQTVNDMLSDWENTDTQALAEALSNYYDSHNNSFDGLIINSENFEKFDIVKEWAKVYYCCV